MIQSKLFEIVGVLNRKQKKDLDAFIQMSSNHLPDKDEELLRRILKDSVKKNKLNDEYVIQKHFDQSNEKKWNKLKSKFLKVIENYLALSYLNETPLIKNIILMDVYSKYKVERNYNGMMSRVRSIIEKKSLQSEWHSLAEFRFLEIQLEQNKYNRILDHSIEQMKNVLDLFYFENKLRLLAEQCNREVIVNSTKIQSSLLDDVRNRPDLLKNYRLYCYFIICQLFNSGGVGLVNKIKKCIQENEQKMSENFLKTIYGYLLNYYVRKLNSGEVEYAINYIETIDGLITHDILVENNYISPGKFKNCITIALLANNNNWAKEFLYQFQSFLPKENRDAFIRFNHAQILFFEGNLEACEMAIIGCYPNDMYYKIAHKKLMLKLYYEQYRKGQYPLDKLRTFIDSARNFINTQHKLSNSRKDLNLCFLSTFSSFLSRRKINMDILKGKMPIVDFVWMQKKVTPKG